jgi:hydroxyethylthiazole kinase-like uncharacterized protein yjeF
MLKILTSVQTKLVDEQTMSEEPIKSIDLMERAAQRCCQWIMSHIDRSQKLAVIAGPGNNGGDALAIARILHSEKYEIKVFDLDIGNRSNDCDLNLKRLKAKGISYVLISEAKDCDLSGAEVIIDGMFGSGLTRAVEGVPLDLIKKVNESKARVVSIDIPSGMFGDRYLEASNACIEATDTLCLHLPKLTSLIPILGNVYGRMHLIDIGLSEAAITRQISPSYYVDSIAEYQSLFSREKFDHKGKYGHVLIVAGSHGKMGAAIISNRAGIKSGAGLVTALVPEIGLEVIQSSVPEVMAVVHEDDQLKSKNKAGTYDAIGIGPGIGTDSETLLLFEWILQHNESPMVVDADALNLLALNKKLWPSIPKGSILTPHIKEFERLFGSSKNELERIELLRSKATELGMFIVLKGAHTAIATPDSKVFFNSTGNPGMATAGSGDCLTGLITGILAQIKDPQTAAICGVYLHGVAGDLAAINTGFHTLVATDIVDQIGSAFKESFSFEQ